MNWLFFLNNKGELTNYPNGVSAQERSVQNASAGDGDMDAKDVYASGALIGAAGSHIGETVNVIFSMGSVSTARAVYAPVPVNGNVVAAHVVQGVTVAIKTLHTLLIGSAGTEIATVTSASGTEGLVTAATFSGGVVAVTTANSLRVTRAVQGTAGDTWFSCTIARTSS